MVWLGAKDVITERATTAVRCPDGVMEERREVFQTALVIFELVLKNIENNGEREGGKGC